MALAVSIPSNAVIGPNAVLQTEAALVEAGGRDLAERVFAQAGLSHLLTERPGEMIDEEIPKALFAALFESLPRDEALRIAHRAGELTGAYILHNRIPGAVRTLLKVLPARFAAPLLLSAIQKHAWTFAGSGMCTVRSGAPSRIEIENNPLAMPDCAWHVGVFEVLFGSLVSPKVRVGHDHGPKLAGAPCCFEIAY
ncbi:MAG: bacteriochlorophyll 4-vinyl reductase [Alphaproteobacteria bacterium]|nr:bacteriochlorophyll 4-vinyl reductase [Alphaproteobacteria bacterium]